MASVDAKHLKKTNTFVISVLTKTNVLRLPTNTESWLAGVGRYFIYFEAIIHY
jgi:hypothetical protein